MSTFLTGVRTVAAQEFRLRIRAGRWRWLLAAWFVALTLFTVLTRLALSAVGGGDSPGSSDELAGTPMYGSLMLLVLGVGLLIVPALTGQSVNGDRERGTLATLQVTRLTPAEIAVGKFAAAWGTSLVFLALTLPLVMWTVAEGGVPIGRLAVTMLVVALLLGMMCAVAQALSALFTRSTTSAVMSYLTVFALTIGTLIVFGLASAMTTEEVTRTLRVGPPPVSPSGTDTYFPPTTYTETVTRTDRVWWLLAPNPFVVLADAAPALPPRQIDPRTGYYESRPFDPLGGIGSAVRTARQGPEEARVIDGSIQVGGLIGPQPGEEDDRAPVWPYGLALNVLLGAGALLVTTRRLRTPARTLPRGLRVA